MQILVSVNTNIKIPIFNELFFIIIKFMSNYQTIFGNQFTEWRLGLVKQLFYLHHVQTYPSA
jgi:hypothetical protein